MSEFLGVFFLSHRNKPFEILVPKHGFLRGSRILIRNLTEAEKKHLRKRDIPLGQEGNSTVFIAAKTCHPIGFEADIPVVVTDLKREKYVSSRKFYELQYSINPKVHTLYFVKHILSQKETLLGPAKQVPIKAVFSNAEIGNVSFKCSSESKYKKGDTLNVTFEEYKEGNVKIKHCKI